MKISNDKAMKKLVILAFILASFLASYSQKVDRLSPLPTKQEHSTDSIMYYGRVLSDVEVTAELVKINKNLRKFKIYNDVAFCCAVATGFSAFGSATVKDNPTPFYIATGVLGVATFVTFWAANEQLRFDNLYITPTGMVYKF